MPFKADNGRKLKPIDPGQELSINLGITDVGVLAVDLDSPRKIHVTLLDTNLGITVNGSKSFVPDREFESMGFMIRYKDSGKAALRINYIPEEDEVSLGP